MKDNKNTITTADTLPGVDAQVPTIPDILQQIFNDFTGFLVDAGEFIGSQKGGRDE